MKPSNTAIAELRIAVELIKYNREVELIGGLVAERMILDAEYEADLIRFRHVEQHATRFAAVVSDVVARALASESPEASTAKISASADRIGASTLHYISAARCDNGRELHVTVKSVISDTKV